MRCAIEFDYPRLIKQYVPFSFLSLQPVLSVTMGSLLSTSSTSCSFLCFQNPQKQRCKVRCSLIHSSEYVVDTIHTEAFV